MSNQLWSKTDNKSWGKITLEIPTWPYTGTTVEYGRYGRKTIKKLSPHYLGERQMKIMGRPLLCPLSLPITQF